VTPLHVGHTTTAAATGCDPAALLPFLLICLVAGFAGTLLLGGMALWIARMRRGQF